MSGLSLIGLLAFGVLTLTELLIPSSFNIIRRLATITDSMAFHAAVITGTCKGSNGDPGSITILASGFIALHGIINMLLLTISIVIVAYISIADVAIAVIRPMRVLFELGMLVRHILF